MKDPFEVLGLPPEAGDEEVRARYLELVRRHPPERSPARFSAVRDAYEAVKTLPHRVALRVFRDGPGETVDDLIEELECPPTGRRYRLSDLLREANRKK